MSDKVEYGFFHTPMSVEQWDSAAPDVRLATIEEVKVMAIGKALRDGFLLKQHTVRARVLREQMSSELRDDDGVVVKHPAMVCIHVTAGVY